MITVQLVDDQALVRAGFHALLEAEDGSRTIHEDREAQSKEPT